jgi:exopolyphosphatase/guanosine-5'-triphosphate,3'-diphosphate pyrophosphatase
MREAVLDIGSNTGHLLVVDAHRGAAPLPASSVKAPLRLAEHLTPDGSLSDENFAAPVDFVKNAMVEAEDQGCEEEVSSRSRRRPSVRRGADGVTPWCCSDGHRARDPVR